MANAARSTKTVKVEKVVEEQQDIINVELSPVEAQTLAQVLALVAGEQGYEGRTSRRVHTQAVLDELVGAGVRWFTGPRVVEGGIRFEAEEDISRLLTNGDSRWFSDI